MTPIREFQQGMKWRCPACWRDRQELVTLGKKECPCCGYERSEWALDFHDALCIAMKQAKNQQVRVEESCHCCGDWQPRNLTLCMSCGKESCWCWEVDVLKYFEGDSPPKQLDSATTKLLMQSIS